MLFRGFSDVCIRTVLTHGDLLTSGVGEWYRGLFFSFAKPMWPRAVLLAMLPRCGVFMLIEAKK